MSDRDVAVRAMLPADVPAAFDAADEALREAGPRYGWELPPLDDARRARGEGRHAHLLRTDPAGAHVAVCAGEVVGVALALRRGPLWFLSLLAVRPEVQARGVGGRLLDAALRTAEGAPAGMVLSSSDPKALRRYGRAGFALEPGYDAVGTPDRSTLPATPGVRDGAWAAHGERVDALAEQLRGAPYGPDLERLQELRLLVADGGYAVLRPGALACLGAADPATAQQLLWAALAELGTDLEIAPFTARQQWGIEVALAARLTLRPGESVCVRGALGPLTPYLPSGAYG